MLFRLMRGHVLSGREDDFIQLLRQQVAQDQPAGLVTFMAGYRRVERMDQFVLASAWESEADAIRLLGEDPLHEPKSLQPYAGMVELVQAQHYQLMGPVHRGLLDAPGAVLRVARATVRPGRMAELEAWLERKAREINASQLLLGWAMGMQMDGDAIRVGGVSAWASPLQIEAVAEPGRSGQTLFAALDEFIVDFELEQYQAIELRLPDRLADHALNRVIVARLASLHVGESARAALRSKLGLADDDVSLASLAHDVSGSTHVLVARVTLTQHGAAERMIADHGGQIVYEADERGQRAAPGYAAL